MESTSKKLFFLSMVLKYKMVLVTQNQSICQFNHTGISSKSCYISAKLLELMKMIF